MRCWIKVRHFQYLSEWVQSEWVAPEQNWNAERTGQRVKIQLDRFTTDEARHVFFATFRTQTKRCSTVSSLPIWRNAALNLYPHRRLCLPALFWIWRKPRGICIAWEDRDNIDTCWGTFRQIISGSSLWLTGNDSWTGRPGHWRDGYPGWKTLLYSACGGIDPQMCLPVVLDVEQTMNHYWIVLYIWAPGIHDSWQWLLPVSGTVYCCCGKTWPGVLLQFEDFALKHATPLLKNTRIACVVLMMTFRERQQCPGNAAVCLPT